MPFQRRDTGLIGEIPFPQAVCPYDLERVAPARLVERESVIGVVHETARLHALHDLDRFRSTDLEHATQAV